MPLPRALIGYEFDRRLGNGGLGELWRARDRSTLEVVALRMTVFPNAADIVEALASVVALHSKLAADVLPIVRVLATGGEDGRAWYSMEFADGESILSAVRRHGEMPAAKVVPLVKKLADCIATLHSRNVLHQDLNARNVFVDRDEIHILELGVGPALARVLQGRKGTLASPRAKAPEQLVADAEPRTDIYAIGCIAYYLLTGRKAIADGASHLRLATGGGTRPPRLDNIAAELRPTLARMLAMRPEDRFASASELSQALAAVGSKL